MGKRGKVILFPFFVSLLEGRERDGGFASRCSVY